MGTREFVVRGQPCGGPASHPSIHCAVDLYGSVSFTQEEFPRRAQLRVEL